jgi:hypothetical protein
MAKPGHRIFVSSTWQDLRDERAAVEKTLHRMRDTIFAGMEYFGSRPDKPKEVCLREVADSDVYIGIVGGRYGAIDSESNLSFTELEYLQARSKGLPCLIYIKEGALEDDSNGKLRSFKDSLLQSHVVSFFQNADQLATMVSADLHNLLIEGHLPKYNKDNVGPTLRTLITEHFDLEELRDLCFNLGIDFDDLRGEGKTAKARELVLYAQRRDRLNDLVIELKRLRPTLANKLEV